MKTQRISEETLLTALAHNSRAKVIAKGLGVTEECVESRIVTLRSRHGLSRIALISHALVKNPTVHQGVQPKKGLSSRQSQILELVAQGLSNKEIAGRLGVGICTVTTHRKKILSKFGKDTSLSQLMRYYLERTAELDSHAVVA